MVTTYHDLPDALKLFDHLADAVYLLDPESSNIVWCNRLGWESLGLTPEAVLDHSVLSLHMDVTGTPQWSEIADVIRATPCYTFVGRHQHVAGHEVAVEVNTTRFFDRGREYFLSVARDVTLRLALESDMKTRHSQLWFALNEAMDGLWDWDADTGAVFFSPQLKRMLGYGPHEMAPRLASWTQSIHPDDAQRVQRLLQEHLSGRRARYEAEYRLRTRNGHYPWVSDRGRVCDRDAAGRATRVVGMVQDVTQEREARTALQRSEQAQRTLIAALPDVIMRLDAQGRHLFVSDNIATLTSLPVSSFLGRTHRELGLPEDQCRYWDHSLSAVLRTGQAQESAFELDGPQGRRIIGCRVVPEREPGGAVPSVLAVCRDITDQRRAEAELAQHRHHLEALVAQRTAAASEAKAMAESANRAKSHFLAHMSHELRTPMGAILGLTELARERAQDAELQSQLDKIQQASHHLLTLINDILDLSKIEADRMRLEQSAFRLDHLLGSVVQLAGHHAQAKGLQLDTELAPALAGRSFLGDPLRLKQILLNLVDNAVKFTALGRVTVSAHDVGASLVRFEVTDDGIGIAPEQQARLFLPFEQGDRSTPRRYGGTGLGLSIARQLTQRMHGEIGVDSTPGKGSCFWFTAQLPGVETSRADPDAPRRTAEDDRASLRREHAGKTVLVAEDDPVCSEICAELLRRAGLQVRLAEDGEAAVALAQANEFALVLMDMQMPRLNGPDATARIRAAGRNRHTPIVAVTANAFEEDRRRCLDAGMDAFLTKPLDSAQLYATAAAMLARALPVRPDSARPE